MKDKDKNKYLELEVAQRAFAIMRDLQEETRRIDYLLEKPDLNEYLFKQGTGSRILVNHIIINRADETAIQNTEYVINKMLSRAEDFREEASRSLAQIRQQERKKSVAVELAQANLDAVKENVRGLGIDTTETIKQIDAAKDTLYRDLKSDLEINRKEREDYTIPYGFFFEGIYLLLEEVREDYPLGTMFRLASRRAAAIETGKVLLEVLDSGVSKKKLAELLGIPKEYVKHLVDLAKEDIKSHAGSDQDEDREDQDV